MSITNPTDIIRQYLKQMGLMDAYCFRSNNPDMYRHFNYHCLADYVLDRGAAFDSAMLTTEERAVVFSAAKQCGILFEPKQCFHNAMMLTMFDGTNTIEFCEGYALTGSGMAVHHAWNVINGKVVDLTRSLREEAVDEFLAGTPPQADLLDRVMGEYPATWGYLGVCFNRNQVQTYMTKNEQTGSLIHDHSRGFPLWLQDRLGNSEPFDPDDWDRLKFKAEGRLDLAVDGSGA